MKICRKQKKNKDMCSQHSVVVMICLLCMEAAVNYTFVLFTDIKVQRREGAA